MERETWMRTDLCVNDVFVYLYLGRFWPLASENSVAATTTAFGWHNHHRRAQYDDKNYCHVQASNLETLNNLVEELTSYFKSKHVINLKPKHRNEGPKNLNVSKGRQKQDARKNKFTKDHYTLIVQPIKQVN
ncbi:unnamed protein product [Dovyalis caffra]|uniref:Uncharacterized protein n=1 Tax=Dovyalis caffra TaxID=77055 RepID=A0AAV1RZH1_9ROSI|nr:unnamed protein product [Dovyalis caffra]